MPEQNLSALLEMPVISKALGDRILASQERPPADEEPPKTVVSTPSPTALLVIDSGDRFNNNESAATNVSNPQRQYNNFVISRNQNVIQGAISRVGLTEVRFPYCIPNVNQSNNTMWVNLNGAGWVQITIDTGFYNGDILALAIQTELQLIDINMEVAYIPDSGVFRFNHTLPLPANYTLGLSPINPVGATPTKINTARSLLDLIGLPPNQVTVSNVDIGSAGISALFTGIANLKYTDFIDIVSFQLTNNQRVKDVNTNPLIPRNAIICRLYIENETSMNQLTDLSGAPANVYGTYPFVIYRQFKTPKMMRWNNTGAVGQIDIALYDMYGNPLVLPTLAYSTLLAPLPDFQLTFQVAED